MITQPEAERRTGKRTAGKAYSFARAGSLWVPEQRRIECIGGGVGGSFAARGLSGGRGDPRTWPGGSGLEAWYRWNLANGSSSGGDYDATLYTSSGTAPAITWTGTVPVTSGLKVEVTTTGTRSTMVARWSSRNGDGTDWTTIGPGLGTTVTIGPVVLALPSATYTAGDVYVLKRNKLVDQKHAHHFVSMDGTLIKNPIPKVTPYGTFVQFDGINGKLLCNGTGLGTNVVGGTAKAFYCCGVLNFDSVAPAVNGAILFFGDGTTNHANIWFISSTPNHKAAKQDNTGVTATVTGGTPDTAIHVYELDCDGTSATIRVDGSVVATGAQAPGGNALTVSLATLGCTFNGGAEGNLGALSLGELALYSTRPTPTDQTDIAARMRLSHGF